MYEHEILQLGLTKRNKIKNLLDKKAQEGWELISVVPDIGMNQQGFLETKMTVVLKRPLNAKD